MRTKEWALNNQTDQFPIILMTNWFWEVDRADIFFNNPSYNTMLMSSWNTSESNKNHFFLHFEILIYLFSRWGEFKTSNNTIFLPFGWDQVIARRIDGPMSSKTEPALIPCLTHNYWTEFWLKCFLFDLCDDIDNEKGWKMILFVYFCYLSTDKTSVHYISDQ